MSALIRKDKTKSLLDEDSCISDVITEAFDNVELTTIGKLCLDARVSKSLTQEQASNLLKVRVKIIKDFENGEQIDLPGTAYKIGFVRSYARLLELDSELLVQEFKEKLEVDNFKQEYKFLSPETHNNNKILPIGALLSFFIALVIYTGWYYTDRNNKIDVVSINGIEKKIEKVTEAHKNSYVIIEENFDPKNSVPAKIKNNNNNNNNKITHSMFEEKIDIAEDKKNSPINFIDSKQNNKIVTDSSNKVITENIASNEMSAKANERDPSNEMVLKAIGNSWVEIEDLDGNIVMTRLMRPGETYVVPKINGLTFNTGNAGALSLSQGDVVVKKLGEIGEIITARPLNIKAFSRSTQVVE